ncbi:MAG: M42 family metallopeptidase [Candidatus Lokiarchaeota archaeon]
MIEKESIKKYQEKLSTLIGVSGYEDDVSEYILNEIKTKNLADKAWIDPLGNVLAIVEGSKGEGGEKILLDAHIDEIGFMISHIDKKGFLKFVPVGMWDDRIFVGQAIVLKNAKGKIFHGIIGSKPPHLSSANERKKKFQVNDLYIDIGMNSRKQAEENGIKVGTVGTLFSSFEELPNNMVRGKAFDDRTGCNVLLHILMLLKENPPKNTVLFNFAAQEEVGGRGATTGAFNLNPTIAIALENTTAGDVPGIKPSECPCYIAKGPAITIADKSVLSSPYIIQRLEKNGEKEGIQYQYKKPMYGGTDAGRIHIVRKGIPSAVVSVPCRYIHSPTSLLKIDDIEETIKLIEAFVRNPAKIKGK